MITNPYIVFDFETGSKYPETTQPIQLAAVLVDPIKLEIIEGSEFESLIQPVFDINECKKLNIAPIEDEALNVNKKTITELEKAPKLEHVWTNFTNHVKTFQKGKNNHWNAPIPVGYNIARFDLVIVDRLCKTYGPFDDKNAKQKIFHPIYYIDVMQSFVQWFSNWNQINSFSLSKLLEVTGVDGDGAHDAMVDVKNTANMFIRFSKLYRSINEIGRAHV